MPLYRRPGSRGVLSRAILLAGFLCFLGLGGAGQGEGPAADIPALIRQLGSDDFDQREAASKRLAELGEEALEPLKVAARSPDAEVRRRAAELVAGIERKLFGELAVLIGHTEGLWTAAFSPDGKQAATCSDDKTLRLWNLETGRELGQIQMASAVNCARYFSTGDRLLVGLANGDVLIYETSGKQVATIGKHGDEVVGLELLPGEKEAVTVSRDKTLKRWNLAESRLVRTCEGHTEMIRNVAISADGQRAATASFDGNIRVWDLETGEQLLTLQPDGGMAFGVRFSPDGVRLVTGSADRLVRIWDLASGKEVQRFSGHTGFVYSALFLSGGRRVMSASEDGTVRVWDVRTGDEVRVFRGHTDYVRCVELSPDGRRFLSASKDHTARLWGVPRE
jgi:WD40 repeat protein